MDENINPSTLYYLFEEDRDTASVECLADQFCAVVLDCEGGCVISYRDVDLHEADVERAAEECGFMLEGLYRGSDLTPKF